MDIKLTFSLIVLVIITVAGVDYVRAILKRTTKPHVYTWLVWSITTGIAALGVFYGHGGYPALTTAVGSAISFIIFFLSIKYGTRDITLSDTLALVFCLVAILIWAGLHNPLWSVILAASIDIAAYWPTLRKTYLEPWSESLSSWILWLITPVFSVLALGSYNIFTLVNFVPIFFVNALFLTICLVRRKSVPKPV